MLKPYGDLDFEDAVALYAQVVRLGVKYGADLIFIETMCDSYEIANAEREFSFTFRGRKYKVVLSCPRS